MSEEIERKDLDITKIDWDEHAGYWNEYDEAIDYTQRIFKLLSDRIDIEGLDILDFGCGTGLLTDHLSKQAKQIVAVDSSEKMIEVLKNKKLINVITINAELSNNTVQENPVLDEKFDLIVAASVCAFLPNYEEVLTTIKSLLKPNGIFVQWDWMQTEEDANFGFTKEQIKTSYKNVGLKLSSLSVPFFLMEKDVKMEVLMAIGER